MMMPLLSSAAGFLHFQLSEGSVLNPGDLIATLDLDHPEAVTKADPYQGGFPDLGPPQVYSSGVDHRFKKSLEDARMILAGCYLLLSALNEHQMHSTKDGCVAANRGYVLVLVVSVHEKPQQDVSLPKHRGTPLE